MRPSLRWSSLRSRRHRPCSLQIHARPDVLLESYVEMRAKVNELQVHASPASSPIAQTKAAATAMRRPAMLLALEALPDTHSNKQRPPVPEAEAALFKAYHALRESVVLKEHTGPLWSAASRQMASGW